MNLFHHPRFVEEFDHDIATENDWACEDHIDVTILFICPFKHAGPIVSHRQMTDLKKWSCININAE